MLKLVVVLLAVIGVQSWGIYGAVQADRIVYTCTMHAGPLCYQWEQSKLAKLIGVENAEKLEGQFSAAKDSFDEDFAEKFLAAQKNKNKSLSDRLKDAGDKIADGIEDARRAASKAIDPD